MPIYYFDGFRGFNDTFLSLSQVNFLVGENSTGKTSIMTLISLMNNPNFWLNFDFNTQGAKLGSFEDMASSKGKSATFSIGYSQNYQAAQGKQPKSFIYIVRFDQAEGIPRPFEFVLCISDFLLQWVAEDKSYKYRFTQLKGPDGLSGESALFQLVLKTLSSRLMKSIQYKAINDPFIVNFPPFFLPSRIASVEPSLPKDYINVQPYPPPMGIISLFAPIRAKPQPYYQGMKISESPEGDHTPYILKVLMEASSTSTQPSNSLERVINRFGEESGLYDSIKILKLGKKKTSPFELDIVKNGMSHKISSVGYGVSQILPILVDILAKPPGSWFSIQQPEVHLHPRAQAAFGELLYQVATSQHKWFLIETHSDYLIDRYRVSLAKSGTKVSTKLFFFEKKEKYNAISELPIGVDGKLPESQPASFRDFFVRESLKVLEL